MPQELASARPIHGKSRTILLTHGLPRIIIDDSQIRGPGSRHPFCSTISAYPTLTD
jgi:hypothetical protein